LFFSFKYNISFDKEQEKVYDNTSGIPPQLFFLVEDTILENPVRFIDAFVEAHYHYKL
jgi:hypothetical protein